MSDEFEVAVGEIEEATKTEVAAQQEAEKAKTAEERAKQEKEKQARAEKVEALVAKYPNSDEVVNSGARHALQAGDFEKGLLRADRAVELARQQGDAEGTANALTTRSLGAWYTGNYPQAARDAEQVLQVRPNDPVAKSVYELSKNRTPEMGAALKKSPANTALAQQFSDLLMMSGMLNSPEMKAAGARATGRQDALKYVAEGARLIRMNDADGVLKAADAAQKIDPTLPDSYMQRAIAHTMQKRSDKAMEELNKAVAVWGAFPRKDGDKTPVAAAHTMRAGLLNDKGRPDAAFVDADKAVQLNPKSANAFFQRARAREALKQTKEDILADFKAAAELDPKSYGNVYDQAVTRLGEEGEAPAQPAAGGGRTFVIDQKVATWVAGAVMALTGLWLFVAGWRKRKEQAASDHFSGLANGKLAPGARVAHFRIEKMLGKGGMGEVWMAIDESLGRPVALKRLPPERRDDEYLRDQLIAEARKAAALQHPNICMVYSIFKDERGEVYIPFEHIDGRALVDIIEEDGPLSLSDTMRVVKPITEALDYAHARGVIHRDIKPSNLMITRDGVPKVLDFGIARVSAKGSTKTTMFSGTPAYSPPEAEYGVVDRGWDVYSLAVTIYELLTGRNPFLGPQDKLEGKPQPMGSGDLDAFFKRALAGRPEDRFKSGSELWAAFSRAAVV